MTTLYPTKTRLALLIDARAGYVIRDTEGTYWLDYGDPVRVTGRVNEAMVAGWLKHGPRINHSGSARQVVLTDAGRAVLDAQGGAR